LNHLPNGARLNSRIKGRRCNRSAGAHAREVARMKSRANDISNGRRVVIERSLGVG
jgi:hypothetical protein